MTMRWRAAQASDAGPSGSGCSATRSTETSWANCKGRTEARERGRGARGEGSEVELGRGGLRRESGPGGGRRRRRVRPPSSSLPLCACRHLRVLYNPRVYSYPPYPTWLTLLPRLPSELFPPAPVSPLLPFCPPDGPPHAATPPARPRHRAHAREQRRNSVWTPLAHVREASGGHTRHRADPPFCLALRAHRPEAPAAEAPAQAGGLENPEEGLIESK